MFTVKILEKWDRLKKYIAYFGHKKLEKSRIFIATALLFVFQIKNLQGVRSDYLENVGVKHSNNNILVIKDAT